jgi:Cu/Ag efflux pump CusA
MVGGMITALLLSLFVIPVAYSLVAWRAKPATQVRIPAQMGEAT